MKAIHRGMGSEYSVKEIIGDRVTLEDIHNGQKRRIDYTSFKTYYKLVNEDCHVENKGITNTDIDTIINEIDHDSKNKYKVRINFYPKIKKEKVNKEKRPTQKQTTTGIDLKTICDELGVDPSKARNILRRKNIEKPGGKWQWSDKTQIEQIKKLLK